MNSGFCTLQLKNVLRFGKVDPTIEHKKRTKNSFKKWKTMYDFVECEERIKTLSLEN